MFIKEKDFCTLLTIIGDINYADLPASGQACLTGDGTRSNPFVVQLDPTGAILCGANGLYYGGTVFSCAALNSCSVGSLSDVSPGGAVDGIMRKMVWLAVVVLVGLGV